MQDGYDLVIRVNPDRDELLMGRRIATDRRVLVAAPSRATTVPFTRAADHESALPLRAVVLATAGDSIWQVQTKDGKVHAVAPEPVLRLSSFLMVRKASRASMASVPAAQTQPKRSQTSRLRSR